MHVCSASFVGEGEDQITFTALTVIIARIDDLTNGYDKSNPHILYTYGNHVRTTAIERSGKTRLLEQNLVLSYS